MYVSVICRYDPENYGTINGEKLMQKFGISIKKDGSMVSGNDTGNGSYSSTQ